jgi:hypothetical protein
MIKVSRITLIQTHNRHFQLFYAERGGGKKVKKSASRKCSMGHKLRASERMQDDSETMVVRQVLF